MDINNRREAEQLEFKDEDKTYLRRFFYQALSFCEIETNKDKPILDLTKDDDFKIKIDTSKTPHLITYGKYIFEKGVDTPEEGITQTVDKKIFNNDTDFHQALRERYLNTKELKDRYAKHIVVFLLPEDSYMSNSTGSLQGASENIGGANKCLVLFPNPNKETMAHEALHTIGLYHPFSNTKNVNNKYRYKYKQTDNAMDYGGNYKHALWRWQWRIMNPNLNKK